MRRRPPGPTGLACSGRRSEGRIGAGQHGDQPRLSDIFLREQHSFSQADVGGKDPYNAMRFLNQEIDEEIENKNSMLKDLMPRVR